MVIKKCISSILLLVTIIIACSCVPKSTESTPSLDGPDYDVNSVAIDVTFDDIVDECLDVTGFDDPRNSEEDLVGIMIMLL